MAIDLYRPVSLLGWWLAADLGRAAYHLLTRGLAPTVVGAVLFDLRFPREPLTWLRSRCRCRSPSWSASAIRMLVTASAFWLLDDTGVRSPRSFAMFFSGLVVPLVLFPGWTRDVAMALPWAAFLQVPADIWLGQRAGGRPGRAGFQAGWAAALLGLAPGCCALAARKVVVQGG